MEQQNQDESPMECIKITHTLVKNVKAVQFADWKRQKVCKVESDQKQICLELLVERSDLRNRIFDALKMAQQKNRENGATKEEPIAMEVQIPSNKCGLLIGTEGETIKRMKAETGVTHLYIDDGKKNRMNKAPRPGFSWLFIGANHVEKVIAALERAEQLLETAANWDSHGVNGQQQQQTRQLAERRNRGRSVDGQRSAVDGQSRHRMRIPAAEYFSDEQLKCFDQIRNKYSQQVNFELGESDPGERNRFVTLSGDKIRSLQAKSELNTLIAEVEESMQAEPNTDDPPSPPVPPNVDGINNNRSGKPPSPASAPVDPFQAKSREKFRKELLVPAKCVFKVIGNSGETIKKLQKEFGVKMAFMGENCLDYPDGRTLSIVGDSMEKVQKARDFVDKEFILAKWDMMNTQQMDLESAESEEVILLDNQFSKREDMEAIMLKMKKESGIISYAYYAYRPDGHRPAVLKGSEKAVQSAVKMLRKMQTDCIRTMGNSRTRSLDEISITSFAISEKDCGIWRKAPEMLQLKRAKKGQMGVGKGINEGMGETCGNGGAEGEGSGKKTTQLFGVGSLISEDGTDDELISSISSSCSRQQKFSQSDASTVTIGSDQSKRKGTTTENSKPIQRQMSELAQQIFSELSQKDQMLKEMEAKIARVYCIECHNFERSVLFIPCLHLLLCKNCAESVQKCPICKKVYKKFDVTLDLD